MKNLLLLLIAIFFSSPLFSQVADSTDISFEHIKFMGIPMEGSTQEFMKRLKEKGFVYETTNNVGTPIMTGKFAGYYANLLLEGNKNKEINRVGVLITKGGHYYTTWKELNSDYEDLKSLLTKKYGEPQINEIFERKDVRDSDKFHELTMGRCDYSCIFTIHGKILGSFISVTNAPIGNVILSLIDKGYIQLVYIDFENTDSSEKERLDDV